MEKEGRRQRYLLMSQVCQENHTRSVVVAHHGDDQIETFLMRSLPYILLTTSLYRGSGYAGLACMKPVQEMDDGTQRIRPLLPVSKDRLLATCQQSRIPYVIDPSNQDLQYDRNRIRAAVSEIKRRELMDVSRLLRAAAFFQLVRVAHEVDDKIRNAVESEVHQRLEECCEYNRELGICRLNASALCALSDPEIMGSPGSFSHSCVVLRTACAGIGGSVTPSEKALHRVTDTIRQERGMKKPMQVAGCVVQHDRRSER